MPDVNQGIVVDDETPKLTVEHSWHRLSDNAKVRIFGDDDIELSAFSYETEEVRITLSQGEFNEL